MRLWVAWILGVMLGALALPNIAQEAFAETVRDGVVVLRFADMTRSGALRFDQVLAALDEDNQPYIVLDQRVRNQEEAAQLADRYNALALLDGFQTQDGRFRMRLTWSTRAAQLLLADTSASALDIADEPLTLTPDMPATFVSDYLKGNFYYALDDDENALRFLELAYFSLPRGREVESEALQLFVTYAILLSRINEHRQALEAINFAIQIDPEYAYSYFVKARALRLLQRYREALEAINRALAINNLAMYHNEQGRIHLALNEYDLANDAFNRARDVSPDDAAAWVGLGDVAYFSGDVEGSVPFYLRATELDPFYSYAFYSLAYSHYDLGQLGDALRAVRRALSLDPEYADAVLLLADIFYAQGNAAAASEQYQRYLALGGQPLDYFQDRIQP